MAYVVNYDIVTRDGATAASLANYPLPVVSITLGAAGLGERINLVAGTGNAIVIASVALARRPIEPGWVTER